MDEVRWGPRKRERERKEREQERREKVIFFNLIAVYLSVPCPDDSAEEVCNLTTLSSLDTNGTSFVFPDLPTNQRFKAHINLH